MYNNNHECDLFLLTSLTNYCANNALYDFAKNGKDNMDGWGIGYYINNRAKIIKSSKSVYSKDIRSINEKFAKETTKIKSEIILGHLRHAVGSSIIDVNNHPFYLNFLNYDWLLIHNGSAHNLARLSASAENLLTESSCDSARVFEFMRTHIIDYYESDPRHSLIEACKKSFLKLLDIDSSGKYNLILSNGYLSFVFIHWRSFFMLNREKDSGNTTLISTLKFTRNEEWIEFENKSKAKLLVFNGHTLIINTDLK